MAITKADVKLWAISRNGKGKTGCIVMGGERRGRNSMTWVRTPHSLSSWEYVRSLPPERICGKCRKAMKELVPLAE
jgi:hypothetical protein